MNRADALFAQICSAIQAGEFGTCGDRFLTVRALAEKYACSLRCALEVIQRLQDSRILRTAGKHCCITTGYCPPGSAYGKILSGTRRDIFGVLVNDSSNPFFSALIDHLREEASRSGMELIIASSGGDPRREQQIMDMFVELGCRGVFSCVPILPEQHALFSRYPLPVVSLAEDTFLPNVDAVLVDNHAAGMQVAGHLLECGCKSFAYITLEEYIKYDLRLRGFRSRLLQDRIVLSEDTVGILPGSGSAVSPREVSHFVTGLLDKACKSDAFPMGIFCVHDLLAVEVLRAIRQYRQSRLRVPEDIMVVGFDDLPIAPLVSPPITTVSYQYSAMAGKAYALMDDYLHDPNHVPTRCEVSSSLTVRQSTRVMPAYLHL